MDGGFDDVVGAVGEEGVGFLYVTDRVAVGYISALRLSYNLYKILLRRLRIPRSCYCLYLSFGNELYIRIKNKIIGISIKQPI